MDQQPTYEQLIAQKLVDRPVPDMADAIWTRIEAQLDIDMPTDDTGDLPPSKPSGPGLIGWGLGIVVLALLSIFLITKNKQKTKESAKQTSTPTEQTSKPSETSIGPPTGPGTDNTIVPFNNNVDASPVQQSGLDSTLPQSVPNLLPQLTDTVASGLPESVVQKPPATDSPLIKKRRGVSGLNESDYRIVPKKDSVP